MPVNGNDSVPPKEPPSRLATVFRGPPRGSPRASCDGSNPRRMLVNRAKWVDTVLVVWACGLLLGCGSPDETTSSDDSDLFEASPLGPDPHGSPTRYPTL